MMMIHSINPLRPANPVAGLQASVSNFIEPPAPRAIRPFVVRYVAAACADDGKPRYAAHRTAAASYFYIRREIGRDRFGKTPKAWLDKRPDLGSTGRRISKTRVPERLRSGIALWQEADAAVANLGVDEVVAAHIVASLPEDYEPEVWDDRIAAFIDDQFVYKGMVVDFAIHALRSEDGSWKIWPHIHMLVSLRCWRDDQYKGRRQRSWLISRDQERVLEDAWADLTGLRAASHFVPCAAS
jgi:MobA/MobL family